jgi:hypothetical protein
MENKKFFPTIIFLNTWRNINSIFNPATWTPPAEASGVIRPPIRSRAGCTRGRSLYNREPPAPCRRRLHLEISFSTNIVFSKVSRRQGIDANFFSL